jgi:hypothetical protein
MNDDRFLAGKLISALRDALAGASDDTAAISALAEVETLDEEAAGASAVRKVARTIVKSLKGKEARSVARRRLAIGIDAALMERFPGGPASPEAKKVLGKVGLALLATARAGGPNAA